MSWKSSSWSCSCYIFRCAWSRAPIWPRIRKWASRHSGDEGRSNRTYTEFVNNVFPPRRLWQWPVQSSTIGKLLVVDRFCNQNSKLATLLLPFETIGVIVSLSSFSADSYHLSVAPTGEDERSGYLIPRATISHIIHCSSVDQALDVEYSDERGTAGRTTQRGEPHVDLEARSLYPSLVLFSKVFYSHHDFRFPLVFS